jgi:hypothetical protein
VIWMDSFPRCPCTSVFIGQVGLQGGHLPAGDPGRQHSYPKQIGTESVFGDETSGRLARPPRTTFFAKRVDGRKYSGMGRVPVFRIGISRPSSYFPAQK